MEATEIIIKYAVPAVLNKVLGGPTAIITGYHKAHFVILAKALQESSRDKDIQDQLDAITDNLKKIKAYGSALIDNIPVKPEAPEGDMSALGDPAYQKRVEEFAKGVSNILEALQAFIDTAEDITGKTKANLDKIEKNLDMKGAKWPAMRQISNAARLQDIQFIKLKEMEALSRTLGTARSLQKAYANINTD
jgi:hypothetical protein